jgi:hypothetical protein
LCPPLTMEVRNASRQPPAAPWPSAQAASPPVSPSQTAGAILPYLCPWFGELIPLSALQRSNASDETRPFGNSLHLLLRLQSPPCRPINWHKHTTINGALVCFELLFFTLYLCAFGWLAVLCILFVLMVDLLHEGKFVDHFSC